MNRRAQFRLIKYINHRGWTLEIIAGCGQMRLSILQSCLLNRWFNCPYPRLLKVHPVHGEPDHHQLYIGCLMKGLIPPSTAVKRLSFETTKFDLELDYIPPPKAIFSFVRIDYGRAYTRTGPAWANTVVSFLSLLILLQRPSFEQKIGSTECKDGEYGNV